MFEVRRPRGGRAIRWMPAFASMTIQDRVGWAEE
jgi:hypothetical protein